MRFLLKVLRFQSQANNLYPQKHGQEPACCLPKPQIINMPGDIRQTYSYLIHLFPFYFEVYGFLFLMDGLFCLLLPSNEG